MPSVTTREYNPSTGSFVGNISSLSFGRIIAGTTSSVKVIDFAFTGVDEVSNLKVGLVSSGGLEVNSSPSGIGSDGSASNGRFGIMHDSAFDLVKAAGPLTRHFAGLNGDASPGSSYNVEVGTRDDALSQFVYLDIEIGASDLGVAAGMYKVFFDFE
jgi:hypothetical protein